MKKVDSQGIWCKEFGAKYLFPLLTKEEIKVWLWIKYYLNPAIVI